MFGLRLKRSHQKVLLTSVVIAVFAVCLAVWVGHGPSAAPKPKLAGPALALPTPGDAAGSGAAAAPGSSGAASPTASGSRAGNPAARLNDVPLPNSSIDAKDGGLPYRRVKMVVSSDALIAGLAYKVAHGKPAAYKANWLKSPFVVTTIGHSRGLVAGLLAESGPNATYVTCTVYVDGILRSRHSVHGQYKFTACLG